MDVLDRGIPWTELILRDRNMPNDLSLQLSQRISVALIALVVLNNQFYLFLAAKRGRGFAVAAIPFHLLFHFYNGISFGAGLLRFGWRNLTGRGRAATSEK